MRAHVNRLDKLSASLNKSGAAAESGKIAVIYPDSWPVDVQARYRAAIAVNDRVTEADVIEEMSGTRPVLQPSRYGAPLPITIVAIHAPEMS
jgi:hypothetical protein